MKYAIVNDAKSEARKGLSGLCPNCGSPMISKCGDKKIHHWSHKGRLECDPWWENETQWHRDWKGHFPLEWQEVIHRDEVTGEKHIADVKTDQGWVLEFQHSFLKAEERKARNEFYKRITWIVDGTRLKGDLQKVINALNSGKAVNQYVRKISPEACTIFKDWASIHGPVFFDFGGPQLVLLFPKSVDDSFYATTAITKQHFLEIYRDSNSQRAIEFQSLINDYYRVVYNWNNPPIQRRSVQISSIPKLKYYPNYRRRRRFRL